MATTLLRITSEPTNLPDLREQAKAGGCCKRKPLPTDDDRVVYNASKQNFEIYRPSCWSSCFRGNERQNSETWKHFKKSLIGQSDRRVAELVLSKEGILLDAQISTELTLGRYEALKKNVEDMTALTPKAAALFRAVHVYDIYTRVEVSNEGPGLENPKPLGGRIIRITGGDLTKGTEPFSREKLIEKISGFPCTRPMQIVDAEMIAYSVHRDLANEEVEVMSRDELVRRTMRYLKEAGYSLLEPAGWDNLGLVAQRQVTHLDINQYALLLDIAKEFDKSCVDEGKDRTGETPAHRRVRSKGITNYDKISKKSSGNPILQSPSKQQLLLGAVFDVE